MDYIALAVSLLKDNMPVVILSVVGLVTAFFLLGHKSSTPVVTTVSVIPPMPYVKRALEDKSALRDTYFDRDDLMMDIGASGTASAVTLGGIMVHGGTSPSIDFFLQSDKSITKSKPVTWSIAAESYPTVQALLADVTTHGFNNMININDKLFASGFGPPVNYFLQADGSVSRIPTSTIS